MFGQKPHLPIDLIFGTNTAALKGNSITYVKILKRGWNGHIKLQMMLLRRNRKETNDVLTARSYVQN